jgi:dihydroflavonol-4-reductase
VKILVTGAAGFLGSHLCHRLIVAGHQVRALCRSTSDRSPLQDVAVEWAEGDVTELESMRDAANGCDAAIHTAAILSYWGRAAVHQASVNIDGTRNVTRACREQGVRRLVHVSSVAAIGVPENPETPAAEDFSFNLEGTPLTYHNSKRRAEEAVLEEVEQGLDAVIVNPGTVFGPYGTRYRGAEMVEKIKRRRIVPYFTGGFCVAHVEDVTQGVLAALECGRRGERYILGGENITYRALAERSAQALGVRRRLVPVGPLITGPAAAIGEAFGRLANRRPPVTWVAHYLANRHSFYDSSKARQALRYTPRDFNAILSEILRFLRARQT